jgi:transcriptional regulator with XRE-family HTH domain
MRDKIIEMLKHGLSQTVVASAVGCSDGYVSQILAEEGVREDIALAKIGDLERAVKVDTKIDDIEDLVLERLRNLAPFITRASEAARVFETLNSAKRKVPEVSGINSTPTAPLVQINISQQAAVAFKLSADQQVVEVDGRSMATLPSRVLANRLKEIQTSRPQITDAKSAQDVLVKIEQGIPATSLAHVL